MTEIKPFEAKIDLPLIKQGKVRDIYHVDDRHWLIVTSDRLSAFDVVFPTPIPGKGEVLTQMSNYWFRRFESIIANHLSPITVGDVMPAGDNIDLEKRAVVVKKMKPLAIEAIVRGYLVGSGWKDYQKTQSVCGLSLPEGLQLAQQLPSALFTPSTKADVGDHDENISFERACDIIGRENAEKVRDVSLSLYQQAADYARSRGIIIADTKLEFGLDDNGELVLIDEAFTPDSSRFWPVQTYQVGQNPASFDKQFVRDYLESIGWDKKPPAPELPESIVNQTAEKYQEALRILTT